MNDFLEKRIDASAIRALDAAANRRHRQATAKDADARDILQDILREALKADSLAGEVRLALLGQRSNYSNSTLAGLNGVQARIDRSIGRVIAMGNVTRNLSTVMSELVGDIRGLISAMKRNDKKSAFAAAKDVVLSAGAVAKFARRLTHQF